MTHTFSKAVAGRSVLVVGLMLGLSSFGSGCVVQTDHCDGCMRSGAGPGGSPSGSLPPFGPVVNAPIETNETMVTDPGRGAGVFIEYGAGGTWHVYTSCDTLLSHQPCDFNVVAMVAAGVSLSSAKGDSLDPQDGDTIYQNSDGFELAVTTSNDLDGMWFSAPPGATVRFDVYLAGVRDARYIYWVGGGAIHNGAPSDPIDLTPTTP